MHSAFHGDVDRLEEICRLNAGSDLFYPAAGSDTGIWLQLFHRWIKRYVFNDLFYRSRDDRSFVVPPGFQVASRSEPPRAVRDGELLDCLNGVRSWREIQPSYHSLDVSTPLADEITIVRRRGFGQYALAEFSPSSIGVFVHRSDSQGEGGSNMCFLGNVPRVHPPLSNLWDKLNERLADRAIVISDGSLVQFKHLRHAARTPDDSVYMSRTFVSRGREWQMIGRMTDRPRSKVWEVARV